jgi:deoxyribonuclease-4
MNIGAHVRGGGTLVRSLEAGTAVGATSIQVFTQSPRAWKPTQYSPEVLARYREALAEHPTIASTYCHATYLINLASSDAALYERSVECLTYNLSVARAMAASGLVLHVGSHKGSGFEPAVARIAHGLLAALEHAQVPPPGVDCPILIENAAGAGGTVGRSLDEIEVLLDACANDERLGLCVDTQHLWASGVDFSSPEAASALVEEVDRRLGAERLRCVHLNDSKVDFGANRDRHANLGEGTIGTRALAALVGHPWVRDLPLLLEVPGDGDGPRALDVSGAAALWREGVALYEPVALDRRRRATGDTGETRTALRKLPRKNEKGHRARRTH